ncbi:MAG: hypothetical protein Kow0089_23520 [Desulfobulbaceae bacterium]
MTAVPYTEDTLVQQTTAEYLGQELGWESVYAYNNEDFGPESLLGRASDREVVLTRTLRAKIEELNPGLPATAYDDAVRQVVAVPASQTMAAINREKYELIKDGVQVTFRNAKGERVRQRLRVIEETKARRQAEAERKGQRDAWLAKLAADFPKAWKSAHDDAGKGHAHPYDAACRQLVDLRDAYRQHATLAAFQKEFQKFMTEHSRRRALVRRLVKAGLWKEK